MFVLTHANIYVVFGLYILSCAGSGVRRWGLALSIGPNRVDFYLTTKTEYRLRNVVFK
jgi:hypothetical protein